MGQIKLIRSKTALIDALQNAEVDEQTGTIRMSDGFRDMLIEALYEPEPRLLTLDEVKKLPPQADVWIELNKGDEKRTTVIAVTVYGVDSEDSISFWILPERDKPFSLYNDHIWGWRLWTARPTRAQSEAVKWDA